MCVCVCVCVIKWAYPYVFVNVPGSYETDGAPSIIIFCSGTENDHCLTALTLNCHHPVLTLGPYHSLTDLLIYSLAMTLNRQL